MERPRNGGDFRRMAFVPCVCIMSLLHSHKHLLSKHKLEWISTPSLLFAAFAAVRLI